MTVPPEEPSNEELLWAEDSFQHYVDGPGLTALRLVRAEIARRAAPPSGEAPRLTIEQVREALSAAGVQPSLETIFARQFPGQVSDAEVERLADALNALLGSAPQKEQVDSVTSPKDGP